MDVIVGLVLLAAADTLAWPTAARPDSLPIVPAPIVAPAIPSPFELARAPQDELPDAYYTRLKVHRIASYAMLPLFAFQYAAGSQLFDEGGEEADWAENGHALGATGIAALFATNVVTGVPNLIAIWNEPRDRKRRLFHASAMLIASAGFVATGIIAEEAEDGPDGRRLHRAVALSSMGVATVGYLSMLDIFRRDE